MKVPTGVPTRWSYEDIRTVLRKCGFSDEMAEHLNTIDQYADYDASDDADYPQDILCRGITDIICQAPVALEEKVAMLRFLIDKSNLKNDIYQNAYKEYHENGRWGKMNELTGKFANRSYVEFGWMYMLDSFQELNEALSMLNSVGDTERKHMLYLFSEWYDTDVFIEKSYGSGLFLSMRDVMKYITNESEEDSILEEYYRVELWNSRKASLGDSYMVKTYDFYIYNGNVCWFEKKRPDVQENGNTYYMPASKRFTSGWRDLNRSVPYRTGDIVSIDCRPFGPPFHAVIVESAEAYDCCFPNMTFKVPYTDNWRIASLKHKRFYKDAEISSYCPMLSPLFRLRRVEPEEMTDEDRDLMLISKALEGDEARASQLWKMFPDDDIGFDELNGMLEQLKHE